MKVGIGIRAGKKAVFFSVFSLLPDNTIEPLVIDKINIPEALDNPQKLAYIRINLLSIILKYNITNAGIRIIEGTAQTKDTFRNYLEGIIQELFVDSSVEKYFLGTKIVIAKHLSVSIAEISGYIAGENNFIEFDDIPKTHIEKKESILTALAALEL